MASHHPEAEQKIVFLVMRTVGRGYRGQQQTNAVAYIWEMAEVQAGLDIGAEKFQLLGVFESEKALNDVGLAFGVQATAAAKAGDKGSSQRGRWQSDRGVWLYIRGCAIRSLQPQ